jgi:hypothetical protein
MEGELTIKYSDMPSLHNHTKVILEKISSNIQLPTKYITQKNYSKNKIDTLYTKIDEQELQPKIIGSFYDPNSNNQIVVLQVSIQKNGKAHDIVLF